MNENNNIALTCESDGRPKGEIKWFKGGVQLFHDENRHLIQDSSDSLQDDIIRIKSVLTLIRVSRKDADLYTCKAEDVAYAGESSTQLVVRCKCTY